MKMTTKEHDAIETLAHAAELERVDEVGCVEEFSADPYVSDPCGSEVSCLGCQSCRAHCGCERKPDIDRARALTANLIADLRLLQATRAGVTPLAECIAEQEWPQ